MLKTGAAIIIFIINSDKKNTAFKENQEPDKNITEAFSLKA